MDTLIIKSLNVATKIGVYDWEQRINQQLLIDITIPGNFREYQDILQDALDYDALCQTVTEFVQSNAFALIETVANKVAELIQQQFNVSTLTIGVSKPQAIKNAAMVQVIINR